MVGAVTASTTDSGADRRQTQAATATIRAALDRDVAAGDEHGPRKLKTLIDLVSESNISELEITEADGKVRIVKADPQPPSHGAGCASHASQRPARAAAPCAAAPAAGRRPRRARRRSRPGHVVKSPMVGTFYRSASPGGKPLRRGRRAVKEGEPVCIIEAMKIMNEIEADKRARSTQDPVRERPGGRVRPAPVRSIE